MKTLLNFFQYGRVEARHNGVWMPNEDHDNAMWRNLSLMSDDELKQLRQEAAAFAIACTTTLLERNV